MDMRALLPQGTLVLEVASCIRRAMARPLWLVLAWTPRMHLAVETQYRSEVDTHPTKVQLDLNGDARGMSVGSSPQTKR